ncbi:MAG: hypothetical protein JXA24_06365 [Proteobacteria bacterium]|nr:hypothetical protein [Pseudomonadota bacterium]
MFTSQDFLNFFTEMESTERNMSDMYSALLRSISDPEVRQVISSLYEAEVKHSRVVGEIRRMTIDKSLKTG